jgi:hypothetical protein
MDGDVVSQRPDVSQLHLLDASSFSFCLSRDRIVADDFHSPGLHSQRHFTSDSPQTQNRQSFSIELSSRVDLPVPAIIAHALSSRADGSGKSPDQQARELTSSDAVASGSAGIVRTNSLADND